MSVYTKLNQARMKLAGMKLEKTGHNKFAGYNYFELGDFLVPTQKIFSEVGLCGVVSFSADLATLTITDTDDASQIVLTSPMGSANLKGCHEVQNIGAVETYQRRYLWVSAMEIVEHDALDATTGKDAPRGKGPGPVIGARDGIGDNLPEDWKIYLKDLAREVTDFVNAQNVNGALDAIRRGDLDGDQRIYLENQLDSKVRAALKKG